MSVFPTKILLAADGSQESEPPARVAIDLAEATNSELHVIHVGGSPRFLEDGPRGREYNRTIQEELEKESGQMLRKLTWQVELAGGTLAGAHHRLGGVAEEIMRSAEELGVGLIVLGRRSSSGIGRFLTGSVSGSVLRHARCSVLVVPGDGQSEKVVGGRILIAFDGSRASYEAARAATEIAIATDAQLHLAYVLQPDRYKPYPGLEMWEGWEENLERAKRDARSWIEGQAERIRGEGVKDVQAHLLLGLPDTRIVSLADELGVGLIVIGGRGHGRIRRALIGSVSDPVVRHAHRPVLMMHPGEMTSNQRVMNAKNGSSK